MIDDLQFSVSSAICSEEELSRLFSSSDKSWKHTRHWTNNSSHMAANDHHHDQSCRQWIVLTVRLFVKTRQTQKTHTPTHTVRLSEGHCTEVANDHSVQYVARFA